MTTRNGGNYMELELTKKMLEFAECNKEKVLGSLYCGILNMKEYEGLKNMPYIVIGEDIALVALAKMKDDDYVRVTDKLCAVLHITPEEMMEYARENTGNIVFDIKDLCVETVNLLKKYQLSEEYIREFQEMYARNSSFYLVKAEEKYGVRNVSPLGASKAMLNIREKLGEDFYIVPSSRMEIMVVPVSCVIDTEYLQTMLIHINRTCVKSEEWLSDCLLYFDKRYYQHCNKLISPKKRNGWISTDKPEFPENMEWVGDMGEVYATYMKFR